MVKRITSEQVRQIASKIAERWTIVNNGSYYDIIDTRSIDNGSNTISAYRMYCEIESIYLQMIGENDEYFSNDNDRKNYVFKLKNIVIWLICGFQVEKL